MGKKAKNGMKQEESRRAKRAEWWTGELGKAAELRNPHPSPDSLARFTGRFVFAFPLTSEPGPRLL